MEIWVAANYSKQMLDFPQVNFLYYGVESEQRVKELNPPDWTPWKQTLRKSKQMFTNR